MLVLFRYTGFGKMRKSTKNVKASYRPAQWLSDEGKLQDRMMRAWDQRSRMEDRIQELGENISILSTKLHHYDGCSCVQLRLVEAGKSQIAVEIKPDSDDVMDIEVHPPASDGAGKREFVQDSFHAAVRGNHVAFCGSTSLTPNKFRDYVIWMLKITQGNPLDEGALLFTLIDVPSLEGRKMLKGKEIKSVKIGGPLGAKEVEKISDGKQKKKHVTRKINPAKPNFPTKLLKWLQREGVADNFPDLDDLDQSRLTVSLEIGYDRVKIESDQAALRDFAAVDAVDGDGNKAVSVTLDGGSRIKGDLLEVKDTFRLEALNGNIPRESYFQSLARWLKVLADSGGLSDG